MDRSFFQSPRHLGEPAEGSRDKGQPGNFHHELPAFGQDTVWLPRGSGSNPAQHQAIRSPSSITGDTPHFIAIGCDHARARQPSCRPRCFYPEAGQQLADLALAGDPLQNLLPRVATLGQRDRRQQTGFLKKIVFAHVRPTERSARLHPQTLRQYDRLGLVTPTRVGGRNRLYSANDIVRLREIADLSAQGLSLEGIRRVLELQEEVRVLRLRLEEFRREKSATSLVVWRPNRNR